MHQEPLGDGPISLDQLAELPLILPAPPNVAKVIMDRVFAEAGLNPNMAGEADQFSSILSAVPAGMGSTALPKGDLSDVPGRESLRTRPIEPAIFLTAATLSSNDSPLSRPAVIVRNLITRFVFGLMSETPPPGAEWIGGKPEPTEARAPRKS